MSAPAARPGPEPLTETGTVLEAETVGHRTRTGRTLLENVSFQLRAGERLAIIGPNGAGKTTLLRALAGIRAPSSGRVQLFGRDITRLRPVERARLVAVVGQTDQPDERVTLWDYAGLGRVPHSGLRPAAAEWGIVRAALGRVGLDAFRERALGTLSGGERQRAQIARALAQEPRALFLDEPTNHLDPRARGDLLRLVAGLDTTVVAVLHDLALVPVFATRVAVLDSGRLVAFGGPDAVLTPPIVRRVFGLDVLRLAHPSQPRELTVFDPFSPADGA